MLEDDWWPWFGPALLLFIAAALVALPWLLWSRRYAFLNAWVEYRDQRKARIAYDKAKWLARRHTEAEP